MQELLIHDAARILASVAGGNEWQRGTIRVQGDRIDSVAAGNATATACFDASDLLVLPGMVDIHGDAFERQIQPRPETVFSHAVALHDTDRQLVTNGITTACHGVTLSWEGGLRGRDFALGLVRQLQAGQGRFHADHRLHLRFENHHADGLADALDWIARGWVHFLAFNDHLPSIARKIERPEKLAAYAERAHSSVDAFRARVQAAAARGDEVSTTVQALAAAGRRHGVPMASHDDETRTDRVRYEQLEVRISEFPRTQEAIDAAVALGSPVVMGAPNVLLGGSHCGGLSAAAAVKAGACDILASDYYYPALLHAPFRLAGREQACSLEQAWALVSRNPADALQLRDRGRIEQGCRADLLLVDARDENEPRLVATIAGGKLVYCAEPARLAAGRPLPIAA